MITFSDKNLRTIYVLYHSTNFQDVAFPDKGLQRPDFGLPYLEELILDDKQFLDFLKGCSDQFLRDSVFDNKYKAYKAFSKELLKYAKRIDNYFKKGTKK